jgi:hypothetical protein
MSQDAFANLLAANLLLNEYGPFGLSRSLFAANAKDIALKKGQIREFHSLGNGGDRKPSLAIHLVRDT